MRAIAVYFDQQLTAVSLSVRAIAGYVNRHNTYISSESDRCTCRSPYIAIALTTAIRTLNDKRKAGGYRSRYFFVLAWHFGDLRVLELRPSIPIDMIGRILILHTEVVPDRSILINRSCSISCCESVFDVVAMDPGNRRVLLDSNRSIAGRSTLQKIVEG